MTHSNCALDLFQQNFNCCQSILGAFGPELGLDSTMAMKLGAGFSAGIAYRGETCGAVIGSCLIIGLVKGSDDPANDLAEQLTYSGIKDFMAEFKTKLGDTSCSQLLQTDISTAEGFAYAHESGLFKQRCPKFVGEAAIILESLLKCRSTIHAK